MHACTAHEGAFSDIFPTLPDMCQRALEPPSRLRSLPAVGDMIHARMNVLCTLSLLMRRPTLPPFSASLVRPPLTRRATCASHPAIARLERVVLRRNFDSEVRPDDRHLLHDIMPDLGDLGEEEERKDACYRTETGGRLAEAIGAKWVDAVEVGSGFVPKGGES